MMKFQEVHMCQFTTPTTCYSSPQRRRRRRRRSKSKEVPTKTVEDQPTSEVFRLATENHIIQVSMEETSTTIIRDDRPTIVSWDITSRSVPRDTTSIICVGHSQDDLYPDLEAIALLDPPRVDPQQQLPQWPPMVIYGPSEIFNPQYGGGGDADAGSVISTAQHTISDVSTIRNSNASTNNANNNSGTPNNNITNHHAILRRSNSTNAPPVSSTSSLAPQQQPQPPSQQAPFSASTTSTNETSGSGGDIPTTTPSSHQMGRSHSSGSLTNLAKAAAAANSNNNISMGASLPTSAANSAVSTALGGGSTMISNVHPMARLILHLPHQGGEFVAFVNFSPLAPCVARFFRSSVGNNSDDGMSTISVHDQDDNNNNNSNNNNNNSLDNTLTIDDNVTTNSKLDVGVWVGSSNDTQLRLYVPSYADHRLVPYSLDSYPEFGFLTPVMALDYYCCTKTCRGTTNMHSSTKGDCRSTLAVACQDGTVRIISWEQGLKFVNLHATTVIVDGPIVSLHLSLAGEMDDETPLVENDDSHETNGRRGPPLQVVVGSLCGYVCRLVERLPQEDEEQENDNRDQQDSDGEEEGKSDKDKDPKSIRATSPLNWDGPFMVVQGFWNHALEAEDPVLAVNIISDHKMVAIGTHAGRCLLYKEEVSSDGDVSRSSYFKVWECLLPYSVHGIVAIPIRSPKEGNVQTVGGFYLLVTTRRSIHLFQPHQHHQNLPIRSTSKTQRETLVSTAEPPHKTVIYSAATAKARLLDLIRQRKSKVEQSSQSPQVDDEKDRDAAPPTANMEDSSKDAPAQPITSHQEETDTVSWEEGAPATDKKSEIIENTSSAVPSQSTID